MKGKITRIDIDGVAYVPFKSNKKLPSGCACEFCALEVVCGNISDLRFCNSEEDVFFVEQSKQ